MNTETYISNLKKKRNNWSNAPGSFTADMIKEMREIDKSLTDKDCIKIIKKAIKC